MLVHIRPITTNMIRSAYNRYYNSWKVILSHKTLKVSWFSLPVLLDLKKYVWFSLSKNKTSVNVFALRVDKALTYMMLVHIRPITTNMIRSAYNRYYNSWKVILSHKTLKVSWFSLPALLDLKKYVWFSLSKNTTSVNVFALRVDKALTYFNSNFLFVWQFCVIDTWLGKTCVH